jgi:CRP-like cAMP-binding protein
MKKGAYLHLVGDDPAQIFDNLERLRREQGEQLLSVRRGVSRETFARIPHDKALRLYRHRLNAAAWAVLIELDRIILKSGGRNPVKLSSTRLRAIGVCAETRARALHQLEAAGVVSVAQRGKGLSPLVTHLWFERRD